VGKSNSFSNSPNTEFGTLARIVGWNWNLEENVTKKETNENPTKKSFSRDTTKEG
jgi:hypothetical protein